VPEKNDEYFMKRALALARKGEGTTSPNPHVGAVIVKNGKIISTGYHRRAGEPHAEAIAIEKAGSRARGAALYVNLEPCNHYGRTPPCTEKIIRAGIRRVVIGMRDPNPVASGGVERLKKAGIEVKTGVLEREAKMLNRHFIHWIKTGNPWISIKVALTIDGCMATLTGDSKWITGEEARKDTHRWRKGLDAIMVGINTVLKDDPRLTVRYVKSNHQPVRVIIDPDLRIHAGLKILDSSAKTKIFYCGNRSKPDQSLLNLVKQNGHELIEINNCRDKINLREVFSILAEEGIIKIGIEGGAFLASKVIEDDLASELLIYFAPAMLGDCLKIGSTFSIGEMKKAKRFITEKVKRFTNGDVKLHLFHPEILREVFS